MESEQRGNVTILLEEIQAGKEGAFDELFKIVYEELKQMAHMKLRHMGGPATLDSVAVVNEAYMKLLDTPNILSKSRAQFFALASRAMRSILVDHARMKNREKRGGGERPIRFEDATAIYDEQSPGSLIDLDNALTKLAMINEEACKVVECRYFAGLTLKEVAEVLEIPLIRVRRRWDYARAWLFNQLNSTAIGKAIK